mmetsp:Transcript_22559/g.63324  ORF Transcript_22559/g.63324 Transcript_22559/m.63324 type:complete len:282 (+) Transcript_22559:1993-2838(+)
MLPGNLLSPCSLATAPPSRPMAARSMFTMSKAPSQSPPVSMASCKPGEASTRSSSRSSPLMWVAWPMRSTEEPASPMNSVRKLASKPCVLESDTLRCWSRSVRPMIWSREVYPSWARPARTSSAMNRKKFTRSSGAPGNRARSSSRWEATPTGQLLVWHTRAMMQPVAIMATVPKPYSSAPSAAHMRTSRPLRRPPSARSTTRSRRSFARRVRCVSAKPISSGPPACLMEDTGEAPVPPSWPDTWMTSALALATPEAMVPMPASATSLTLTLACGFTMCRS